LHCFTAVIYVDDAIADAGSAQELLTDERITGVILDH
jgi:hypothetical protein